MRLVPLLALVALLVVACGGNKTAATLSTTTESHTTSTTISMPAEPTTTFLLYTLDPADGKLLAARGIVPHTDAVAAAALHELANYPHSDVPGGLSVTIENGDAKVTGAELTGAAEAQVVYTLTQFPSVKTVNGKARADVEEFVPAILVEHPSPGERVTSPVRVTGNANTFEATFQYKLQDADGKVLAQHFVTATSGTGTRGTFDVTIPFTVDTAQDGRLVVYENSAADGSVIHQRQIPLRLTP
jgi:Immunoglobulin-like domain of bacterial spore germination